MKRVCLVSSGTGGHLLPAVALARALQRAGHLATLLTEGRAVESELLDRCGDRGEERIPARELRVGRSGFALPLRLAQTTMQARRILRDQAIDVLVGTGGRTAVPAAVAARSLGIPVFLLEQNVVTGRANRLLRPIAERIYYGLPPRGSLGRGLVTGTPLRSGVGCVEREQARRGLGLPLDRPVVLVTGGSQGARVLNDVVPAALARIAADLSVLHLAGVGHEAEVAARYDAAPRIDAWVRPVVMDMASLYAAADLVICRGGGGTVAELMRAARAAIIVPYPHHRDRQQWHNGRVLERAGAALLCKESELDADRLARTVGELLASPVRLRQMGERAAARAPAEACEQIITDMQRLGALD